MTGYGPFRRCDVNPSAVIVERLSKVRMDGVDLQTEVIPVAYSEAIKCSKRLCQDVKPDVCKLERGGCYPAGVLLEKDTLNLFKHFSS